MTSIVSGETGNLTRFMNMQSGPHAHIPCDARNYPRVGVAKLAIRAFLNPGRGENVRFVLLARFLVAYDVEISEPAFRSPL